MYKISFYMLPSTCYGQITVDDLCVLEKNLKAIREKDLFFVPDDFYSIKDTQKITALTFLYENEQDDVNTYLLDIISKEASTDRTYENIHKQEQTGYVAFANDDVETEKERICVHKSEEDVIKVKRFYMMQATSYDEYFVWMKDCFPKLLFHEKAFDYIEKLGKFQDIKEELHRHLIVLCDYAKGIYFECNKREEEAFAVIKARYGIICSGKGANEKEFKADYQGVKLTCNPHTKLFTDYSDKRIYFCWGRDNLDDHNIIVVKIGNHWK